MYNYSTYRAQGARLRVLSMNVSRPARPGLPVSWEESARNNQKQRFLLDTPGD